MLYPRSIDGISPNSRTGSGRVRVVSMVAVRHSPISALGARAGAFYMPIGGANVRLFGEREIKIEENPQRSVEKVRMFMLILLAQRLQLLHRHGFYFIFLAKQGVLFKDSVKSVPVSDHRPIPQIG